MAVFSIDISSDAKEIAGILAAITQAGILTTKHYQSSTSLIVTTTRSNKVIRISLGGKYYPRIYIGDSWTSGDAINNQVIINEYSSTTSPGEVNVIITDNVFCIGARKSDNTVVFNVIFTRLNTDAAEYVALGIVYNATSGNPTLYDTTNAAQIKSAQLNQIAISTDGYYYDTDFIVTTAGNVLQSNGIKGIKSLLMPPSTAAHYVRYGNDVVIPGGATNGATSVFPMSILITNGYSWAPA